MVSRPCGRCSGSLRIHQANASISDPCLNLESCTGPWEQLPTSSPYPPLEALQQKRLAARRHKTTYCYDFPSVFSNALRQAWLARAIAGEPGDAPRGTYLEVSHFLRVFNTGLVKMGKGITGEPGDAPRGAVSHPFSRSQKGLQPRCRACIIAATMPRNTVGVMLGSVFMLGPMVQPQQDGLAPSKVPADLD